MVRLTPRECLVDLMRICYKLDAADRKAFMACYDRHMGQQLTRWWPLAFAYYDYKQRSKKWLRRLF